MTFDEFLNSNEQRYVNDKQNIMKFQYNPNIDFLYRSSYGEWELYSKLEFLGFFDKQVQRLYGNSYYLGGKYENKFANSYYVGSIETLENELNKKLHILPVWIDNKLEYTLVFYRLSRPYIESSTKVMVTTRKFIPKFIEYDEMS